MAAQDDATQPKTHQNTTTERRAPQKHKRPTNKNKMGKTTAPKPKIMRAIIPMRVRSQCTKNKDPLHKKRRAFAPILKKIRKRASCSRQDAHSSPPSSGGVLKHRRRNKLLNGGCSKNKTVFATTFVARLAVWRHQGVRVYVLANPCLKRNSVKLRNNKRASHSDIECSPTVASWLM